MAKKQQTFSATKAVKANARERVGQPKPEVVLPDEKTKAERRQKKHKEKLTDLLEQAERER